MQIKRQGNLSPKTNRSQARDGASYRSFSEKQFSRWLYLIVNTNSSNRSVRYGGSNLSQISSVTYFLILYLSTYFCFIVMACIYGGVCGAYF